MNRLARAFLGGFEAAIDAVDAGNMHRGIVDALQSIIAECDYYFMLDALDATENDLIKAWNRRANDGHIY